MSCSGCHVRSFDECLVCCRPGAFLTVSKVCMSCYALRRPPVYMRTVVVPFQRDMGCSKTVHARINQRHTIVSDQRSLRKLRSKACRDIGTVTLPHGVLYQVLADLRGVLCVGTFWQRRRRQAEPSGPVRRGLDCYHHRCEAATDNATPSLSTRHAH